MLRGLLGALLVLSFGLVMFETIGVAWIASLIVVGSIVFILLGKGPPSRYMRWLDDLAYEGEKAIVGVSLIVMSVLVFADVVWATSHDMVHSPTWRTPSGFPKGLYFAGALLALCIVGGFTARRSAPATGVRKLVDGLLAFLALAALVFAIYVVPNGFGWSQRVSLCLMLWVGLLGASMATHEGRHIAVDAVRKIVPERHRRWFELSAGVVTVVLSFVLTVLGARYVRANFHEWIDSNMNAGIFESLPLPYWAATLPIPIGFGLMAFRFIDVALHGPKESDLLKSLGGGEQK